ncbi:hypothetical protein MHBO_002319 [Bonamia ostreae]|uniref:Uncharacterized protein n=1 Tax=Bonamia ostreae TaxID=126728 RepID=A0ABV2ALW3_9EUKA
MWNKKISSGGLVSAMSCLKSKMKWVGYVGMDIPKDERPKVKELLFEINCIPVFIKKGSLIKILELYDLYYNGFSNDVLWPVLHYTHILVNTLIKEEEYWNAYVAVNKLFFKAIQENLTDIGSVWIHGTNNNY